MSTNNSSDYSPMKYNIQKCYIKGSTSQLNYMGETYNV